MNTSKIEPLFLAALSATEDERLRSPELSAGFSLYSRLWEVIIRYTGSADELRLAVPDAAITELLGGYAVVLLSIEALDVLSRLPQVIYIEKPKRIFFQADNSRSISCVSSLQEGAPGSFTGRNVLLAVIDSGIDYTHPDFTDADGRTRILALWDQTIFPDAGRGEAAPSGYSLGTLYTGSQLNQALASPDPLSVCPSIDLSGHGTHVAGIAAGNGKASSGRFRGIAYEAGLLIVKLLPPDPFSFPSTAQLMQAVDFCVRYSITRNLPLAINLSFGNTYGSHSGSSLLETYLNDVSTLGKISIVCGSGNEGATAGHVRGVLSETFPQTIEFAIGDRQPNLNLQIWHYFWDKMVFFLISPNGSRTMFPVSPGAWRFTLEKTGIYVFVGEPVPYNIYQEIYVDFIPEDGEIAPGIWKLQIYGEKIIDGTFQLWMPSGVTRNFATQFLRPSTETTLTIPSTASRLITVGAYDARRFQPADFSGRGYTWGNVTIKPELAAPGVDITSCSPGGGYESRSGTSMAAPFVTGGCACLMQWGIIDGNDPYLYGDKLKAYLIRGAKSLNSASSYPNPETGWGCFCLRNSYNFS